MTDQEQLPEELPLEVDHRQVEDYVYRLADLTTNQIMQKSPALVPPEAVDFLGKERVAMNERINTIIKMSHQMVEAIRETKVKKEVTEPIIIYTDEKIEDLNPKIKELNSTIRSLVSFSTDPALSMSLISRIWKYLAAESNIPFDMHRPSLSPATFHMNLERYAREHNLPPFTEAEKHNLFAAIKDWKLGKSPEEILKMLGYSIEAAAHRASFPTRASREYARNRGINRVALGQGVQRLREIKAFLEELFKQEKPQSP